MSRTLTLLFQRDASRDHSSGRIDYEGYRILWPDGDPVALSLDAFCRQGQRLLGLGRHLAGRLERMIDILCFPLASIEDPITRLSGHRIRRFFLERSGGEGRLHFLDGTPTSTVFQMGRDDPRILHWIGLPFLADGGRQWLDLAARPADVTDTVAARSRPGGRLVDEVEQSREIVQRMSDHGRQQIAGRYPDAAQVGAHYRR
jgi:hypothetical protein